MRIGDICSNNLPSVATIGFFDGVHRGHRFLIDQVRREAACRGLESAPFPCIRAKCYRATTAPSC